MRKKREVPDKHGNMLRRGSLARIAGVGGPYAGKLVAVRSCDPQWGEARVLFLEGKERATLTGKVLAAEPPDGLAGLTFKHEDEDHGQPFGTVWGKSSAERFKGEVLHSFGWLFKAEAQSLAERLGLPLVEV